MNDIKFKPVILGIDVGAYSVARTFYEFYNVKSINEMKEKKKFLEEQLVKLNDEEKALESDIQKLEDPTYVARYAREKYLYSKDGELIIRMPDDEEDK